jgi:23S rRNA (uridine2552-2'-O)-methyltransferase
VKRHRFLKRGDHVLDLGAAPGGWLQAARQVVGERGYVLGVDEEPIAPLNEENIVTLAADVAQADVLEQIQTKQKREFDAVISDLSPNISGAWNLDHARQIELARSALKIARSLLKPSGNMLVKVFQGSELKEFQLDMRSSFQALRIVKPPASRPESAELYFLGLGFVS